jgi:hypothetical protein
MNNPSTILIFSENNDFAETLAVLAAREFAAICKILNSEAEILELQGKNGAVWNLLVVDCAVAGVFSFPIIVVHLPVCLRSLLAEMAEKLHKTQKIDVVLIGENLQLSLQAKTLIRLAGEFSVDLTDKETQLLQAVSGAGAAGIQREELLKNIWGMDAEIDTHTLETHIYRLRKKIRDVFGVDMIKAFEGGYRL